MDINGRREILLSCKFVLYEFLFGLFVATWFFLASFYVNFWEEEDEERKNCVWERYGNDKLKRGFDYLKLGGLFKEQDRFCNVFISLGNLCNYLNFIL